MDYKKRPGKNITTIGDLLNKNIKPTNLNLFITTTSKYLYYIKN